MENKYLQIRKENFFTKFIKFFKGIFSKNSEIEISKTVENIQEDDTKKKKTTNAFLECLKIEREENPELLKLQKQFESNEKDFESLSDEEIESLISLYQRQVSGLKKKFNNKQTELKELEFRINSYTTNN